MNDDGSGSWSEWATVTTAADTAPTLVSAQVAGNTLTLGIGTKNRSTNKIAFIGPSSIVFQYTAPVPKQGGFL
ncbi:MAG: hypothetical protein OXU75_17395 [Deltaproteobacteria bacterium]|nr:hypothetical protein [Deltaproteobacteria bacterium]